MSSSDSAQSVRQPLAIVGASARAAAHAAYRVGFQPITADLFADLDLRRIATATRISPYPEGLLDWLRAMQPPAWMYTGALENYPELVDQMAWIAPLWGNPGDVLADVRNPLMLQYQLREAGRLFPETRTSADGLPRDGSWLHKTYRGASGSGVRVLDEGLAPGEPPHFFQKRLNGEAYAAVFVANGSNSAQLMGATRQLVGKDWLGAGEFQYCGSIGPVEIDRQQLMDLCGVGHLLTLQFSLIGLFGVDFTITDDRIWTLEVNPRYTASCEIIERATGLSSIAQHVLACGMEREEFDAHMRRAYPAAEFKKSPAVPASVNMSDQFHAGKSERLHGKAILFAQRAAVVSEDFAGWALEHSQSKPWPSVADVSAAGTLIAAGRPVVTVFASGASEEEVEQGLRMRVAEVEARLYAE